MVAPAKAGFQKFCSAQPSADTAVRATFMIASPAFTSGLVGSNCEASTKKTDQDAQANQLQTAPYGDAE